MRLTVVVVALVAVLSLGSAAPVKADTTITIARGDSAFLSNCAPFGVGGGGQAWTPYMAFFYKNIPAFDLEPGDVLAFDLVDVNDADIQLEISLARTTTNGDTTEAEPFTTVVTNAQTPANPRGDTTVGNFELQFRAEAPFSFPGGGLIMRFSNPSAAYQADEMCDGTLRGANGVDSSGFFIQRAINDGDGSSPWDNPDANNIAEFRLILVDPPPQPKGARTVSFDVNKSKVKKGKKVRPSGQLEAAGNDPACEASQTVEILRDSLKRGAPQTVATLTTDAQGSFSTKLKMRKTALLSARVPETATCQNAASDSEKVRVKKKKAAKGA